MSKLTVVIPTQNQNNNLLKIVGILRSSLSEIEHQIVVSNNSNREIDRQLSIYNVELLKTPQIFMTAEEHIFWVIEQISGEYVWFLGDDDIPLEDGVRKLAKIVNQGSFDCLTFNGIRINLKNDKIVKMINHKKSYRGKLQYFYESSGLLNGPASISLYVTKKEFLNEIYINEIQELNAPIYSHLTFFLRSFANANFAYFPIDIINHSKSDKKQEKELSPNWIEFAENSGNFYYFPWTLGLLRNIRYLIKNKAIEKDFLSRISETDPRSRRYQLLPQLENYIRLVFISKQKELRQITDSEVLELRQLVSEIPGFSEELKSFVSAEEPSREILRMYPHINPKTLYFRNQVIVLKYKFFVVFRQILKDFFWIFLTKLWAFIPKFMKPFLKKLRLMMMR
jgi:hypothetical protein